MMLRTAALIVALGLLLAPPAADAQPAAKVYRIGVLGSASASFWATRLETFRQGLRELGYVEGQNIAIEYRYAEGKLDRLPVLAAELVQLKVNVIVTAGTPASLAAKKVTGTIPIVLAEVADPVGSGLVASLARPGGNVTGVSLMGPELYVKRLELLKEAIPKLSRVALLWNPTNPFQHTALRETEAAARVLGVTLYPLSVRGPNDFQSAFATATRESASALVVTGDALFVTHLTRIVELTAKNRLPAMHVFREFVDAGGLIAYGPSTLEPYRRTATYVDKLLKGAKPADLPVEQPTKFDLVINLKTAKALGLTIPQSILIRADEVIQ